MEGSSSAARAYIVHIFDPAGREYTTKELPKMEHDEAIATARELALRGPPAWPQQNRLLPMPGSNLRASASKLTEWPFRRQASPLASPLLTEDASASAQRVNFPAKTRQPADRNTLSTCPGLFGVGGTRPIREAAASSLPFESRGASGWGRTEGASGDRKNQKTSDRGRDTPSHWDPWRPAWARTRDLLLRRQLQMSRDNRRKR